MRAMLVGATGQLGSSLKASAPTTVELLALGKSDLDVCDAVRTREIISSWGPDVILNAAAYTAVDQAQTERKRAFEVNAEAPRHLAEAAKATGSRLIHVSTDFVFAGDQPVPYDSDAETRPLSSYGESKRAGELAVISVLGESATIVRTSWLYASRGRNFVLTMLRLMNGRESIEVVYDQVGSPTWSLSLARAIWGLAERSDLCGIHHWCDNGVASWYDFAIAIQEEAIARGLLKRLVPIRAIRSTEYPTPVKRPAYSVLDNQRTTAALGFSPAHWRTNLRLMLDDLARS